MATQNQKNNKTYTVHIMGGKVGEKEVVFSSLEKAKNYMKKERSYYKALSVWSMTLVKRVYDETGDYEATGINTRSMIWEGC